ncbi:hypothetical protein Esi_0008_0104 [Ectocarpus siliculosus]|uniref:G-protein coupled receptors family 2 profile 2 domain-containing protein n=1 Tax=Ectocarpus siliculosus TaxID=2880 RepID=D7G6Z1_ECTSI|nr:hypothetical protein Esi_0008_0104 [Ectocarpus siliculosus]|eukprot:CBJ25684.1 hypothetical protein Esi_0008_0104 [Ectocarpus siliculosus]
MSSKTRAFDSNKRMPWNHLWAWGVSALLSSAPLATGSFGRTESFFCGVDSGDSWNIGSLWRAIFLVVVLLSMVVIVWAYVEVLKTLGRAQRNVFRLSLEATTNRHTEASSVKQHREQRQSPKTHGGASSAPISAMPIPSSAMPGARLHVSPDQPKKDVSKRTVVKESPTEPKNNSAARPRPPTSPNKRLERNNSFWKWMFPISTEESADGERRANGFSTLPSQQRDYAEHSSSSSGSSWPFTRSNSNVSVKNWLWSTSRDVGFYGDDDPLYESSSEGEECKSVVWLNGMAAPVNRRLSLGAVAGGPIPTSPERLPVLRETERGNDAGLPGVVSEVMRDADGAIHDSNNSTRTAMIKWEQVLGRPRAIAGKKCPSSGNASSESTEAAESHGVNTGSLAKAAMMAMPQVPMKSRFANGVVTARGFVSRMSSMDTDFGDTACGTARTRSRLTETEKGERVSATSSTAVPLGAHGGRSQHVLTTHTPEMDMDRFISRIKWYPVIFVLCWMFTLVNGIYTLAVGQANASFFLLLLATLTSRLQGLLNFICYGLNDKLKQAWLQDFLYRRAVASCCRALWCCCFSPCYGNDDGDDEADQASQPNSVLDSPRASNGLNDVALVADEMEKGTAVEPASTPTPNPPSPVISETPAKAVVKKTSMAAFATPRHDLRQGQLALAPARPARPSRKVSSPVQSRSRRSHAAAAGRRKKSGRSTARHSVAAAGVRRQRDAVMRRARTSSQGGIAVTGNNLRARKKLQQRDKARARRHEFTRQRPSYSGSDRKRHEKTLVSTPAATTVDLARSLALPISVSMPVKVAPQENSAGLGSAGIVERTPPPSRPR